MINRLGVLVALLGMLFAAAAPLEARTKKGDKLFEQGRKAQAAEDWDTAFDLYQQALAEDPSDALYQLSVRKSRFQASQNHVKEGKNLRKAGKLDEALKEFQEAFAIDPSSTIAEQELRRTYRMIREREREKEEGKPQAEVEEEEKAEALTALEKAYRAAEERIQRLEGVPRLKPISPRLNTLKMNNQPAKVLYETVGKLAGINVVFDPEFQSTGKNYNVDLTNATLDDALRYLSMLTKTFYKPLSENTIFITNDNVTKRRDYEEVVVKVFYVKNVTKVQELQEIVTAVRSVTDIRRMFTYNSQNAILVRGTRDQVDLAEKLIYDLDKPLAEVVVDVIVFEANRGRTRDLASSIVSGQTSGITLPIQFSPRGETISPPDDGEDGDTGGSGSSIRLGNIGRLGFNDWSVSLPGFLLSALMTERDTKILQRPQVRAADGQKASLRLGERVPFATGSFQPGVGAVGVSPLVSTQFQFADVGVNVDLTPKIHGEDDISMHIEIEISSVTGRIDIGGLEQPIIGQRKVTEDIRVRDGEVTLLGGLSQEQATKTEAGVPGLSKIPIIKWLGFTDQSKARDEGELLIALIPHIVRRPEITDINLKGIAAGSDQVVKLKYASNGTLEEKPAAPKPEPAKPASAPPEPPTTEPAKPTPPKPGAGAALRFNPPAVQTKRGATFSVSLLIDNATDVFNAPLKFKFDSSLLRLNEVRRGTFLSGDGQQVIFTRNILNDSGDASVVLNRLPGTQGMSGAGTLVTLTFQVTGAGATTEVSMPDLNLRDSQMQPLGVNAPALRIQIE